MNILTSLDKRKKTNALGYGEILSPATSSAPFIARKLKKYSRLDVHTGCVNRLKWHRNGRTLASVSDDHTIAITDVHNLEAPQDDIARVLRTHSLQTQHDGNIFGVCFLASDRIIATGGRDSRVCLTDASERRGVACYSCHRGSVKQVINDDISDTVFLTASADGTVRQFDTREPHHCSLSCRNVLISLARLSARVRPSSRSRRHAWVDEFSSMDVPNAMQWIDMAYRESQWASQAYDGTEVKAIAINPVRTELIAVAASDNLVRTFDRRKLSMSYATNDGISTNFTTPELDNIYLPRHFWSDENKVFSTYVAWSPNGDRLAVTYENEHVYLFDRHFGQVQSMKTHKTYRCDFSETAKEDHVSNCIHELEAHIYQCKDKLCVEKGVSKLLYLLLVRNNVGDALLCESLAREAFIAKGNDGVLIFRRIQACLILDNYYMTRKLCLRGARLFPEERHHFDKIRRICHLLLNEKIRETSFDQVTSTLKTICKSYDITSPESDIEQLFAVSETVNEDEFSDSELHVSVGTNMRYSVTGWRRWPTVETCLKLEDSLNREDRHIDMPNTPSDSASESDEEMPSVEYQHEIDIGNNNRFSVQMRVSASMSTQEEPSSTHQYTSYTAEGTKLHRYIPGLIYDHFPIRLEDEHDLYTKIEDPNWRPFSKCRRFSGHCNFGTDIAEVGFWGNDVLVSGSADGSVYLYDINTGRVLDILRGHSENVNCVQVNPQGTLLATSGLDNYVQVWRPEGKYNQITEEDIERAIKEVQNCYSHSTFLSPLNVTELSDRVLHDVIRSLQSPGEPSNCNIQ